MTTSTRRLYRGDFWDGDWSEVRTQPGRLLVGYVIGVPPYPDTCVMEFDKREPVSDGARREEIVFHQDELLEGGMRYRSDAGRLLVILDPRGPGDSPRTPD